jgi:hypothetical protein
MATLSSYRDDLILVTFLPHPEKQVLKQGFTVEIIEQSYKTITHENF